MVIDKVDFVMRHTDCPEKVAIDYLHRCDDDELEAVAMVRYDMYLWEELK